ncbi:hypothetical protein LDENG_00277390, partial [Lucifuga dentata]
TDFRSVSLQPSGRPSGNVIVEQHFSVNVKLRKDFWETHGLKGPYNPFCMFELNIFNFHTRNLNKKRGVNVCLHRGI